MATSRVRRCPTGIRTVPLVRLISLCVVAAWAFIDLGSSIVGAQVVKQSNSQLDHAVHAIEFPAPNPEDERRMSRQLNAERQRNLNRDTAKLVAMTQALKAETDAAEDPFSTAVTLHRIEQIEKLAHKIRDEMASTPGPDIPIIRMN